MESSSTQNDVAPMSRTSRVKQLILSFTIFISFLIIPIVTDGETNSYFFYGGLLGMLSSAYVIYYMFKKEGSTSRSLLMYRAVCDFGVGLRFVLSPIFMRNVCGDDTCSVSQDGDDEHKCAIAAAMQQFFEMASEAWFLCLAYDLAVTITNPFSSSASRIWGYHVFCWVIASIFSVCIARINGMAGFWNIDVDVDDVGICWVRQSAGGINHRTFIFLYIPLCIVYIYAIRVIRGAYGNLKKGISKTFQHRVKILLLNSINIGIYILYWAVLLFFYFWAYAASTKKAQLGFWKLLWFFLSSKGFADLLVFIFIDDGATQKSEDEATAVDFNSALRQEVLHYATTGIRECAARRTDQKSKNKLVLIMNQKNTPLKTIFNIRTLAKIVFYGEEVTSQEGHSGENAENLQVLETETLEIDDEGGQPHRHPRRSSRSTLSGTLTMSDLEHQDVPKDRISSSSSGSKGVLSEKTKSFDGSSGELNKSIRMGGLTSNETGNNAKSSFDCQVNDDTGDVEEYVSTWQKLKNCLCAPFAFYSKFSLNRFSNVSVEFVEYEPYYFRQIRINDNVKDEDYIMSFMKTIKERLTEGGASGAFFFFTKDERFIAKSCTTDEIAHIRRSAVLMSEYLEANPYSFITKIYGAYKLQIYGTSFYFFVTNNIFLNPNNEVINEKYDLKGSWVKRNSTPPQVGQRATCTHCNQKFTFTNPKKGGRRGKKKGEGDEEEKDKCPMQVLGHHEPNVILKDNDLKYKLRLPNRTSKHLITQLDKDSQFLCGLGVMDYSLLVGVHNTEYTVDEEAGFMPPPQPLLDEKQSPSHRKPSRRKTLSNKMPSMGSREDLSIVSRAPLNGRMAVSRIVGPEAYYMGIVDFQQQYDFGKKLERFFKVKIQGKSGDGLSCIEPVTYRQRFLRRMEELVDFDMDEPESPARTTEDSAIREDEEYA